VAAGIKIWDAAGVLIVDLTTRLSRVAGVVNVPAASSGSVTLDGSGTPWYYVKPVGTNSYAPLITVSGNTISWVPDPTYPGGALDSSIIYGVR
jgi:hypothetical protein